MAYRVVTGEPADEAPPRLTVRGLSKRFGSTAVLRNVDLTVMPGEIHGLIGQNGSGKSTLIKILSGAYQPTGAAEIAMDGVPLPRPLDPQQSKRHGLAFVHQSLGLLPEHTVVENVRLGDLRGAGWRRLISWPRERAKAAETLQGLGCVVDPRQLVGALAAGDRATVAIARALQSISPGQGCIVFDESTQALGRDVLSSFYETVRDLAATGTSILLVSHNLEEVLVLADRVTILRDGAVVASGLPTATLSEATVATTMLGRTLEAVESRIHRTRGQEPASPVGAKPAVHVRGVSGTYVRGFDLELAAGEIVGVTGPAESGSEEIAYLLSGARAHVARGVIRVAGRDIDLSATSIASLCEAGVALVPGNRGEEGLAAELSAVENLTIPRVGVTARRGVLHRGWERDEFDRACADLGIVPRAPDLPIGSFSGGNQQKLLLSKWLRTAPAFIALCEPTQAVDVGARADILRALLHAAEKGASLLVSTIDAHDLATLCDRVLIMRDGRVTATLRQPLSVESINQALEHEALTPSLTGEQR